MKKKMKTELCGVCLALLLTACGGPAEENRALPVVSVAQAEAVTGSGSRNYTFISEPCRTTELAFRVGGPVQNFTVQSGQFFRKGQLIAAIDPRDFLVRKERAEALCRQAEATIAVRPACTRRIMYLARLTRKPVPTMPAPVPITTWR